MKLSRIYHKAVQFGREYDPRRKARINSYADTAILHGSPDTDVKKILVGIDIEVAELLLADKIRREKGLDLVLAHHPEGRAHAAFYEVMQLQVDMLARVGIPKKVAQELVDERKREVERRVLSANHMRAVDAARLLGMPFMCVHTPADNHVSHFLEALFKKEKPARVEYILDILNGIPEYKEAGKNLCGPRIILGSPKRHAGEIFMEMTGGTEGPKDAFEKMRKLGVRTLVSMHLSEEHFKKVKDANLNVVIAGHISSDTLGLNLLLDRVEKEERLEITGCSGFRRIRR
ncbi:MAG: NGG1p interacting factor NIF3 [Candidatus Omnitrophica bacterium]|nr:NGG1p interacting factor NIF3 [Candidatus Omnitrophota bacterium]MDD5592555.1 NGG1p interacting factor NIF3 [Candidatus Omnitrophota bacterium]